MASNEIKLNIKADYSDLNEWLKHALSCEQTEYNYHRRSMSNSQIKIVEIKEKLNELASKTQCKRVNQ